MPDDDRPDLDAIEPDEDGELIGVRVTGARAAGRSFARARFVDVELVRCDLAGCDFGEAVFHRVRLLDCRGTGIELGGASWRTVTVADSRFDDANLRLTQLATVRFTGSVCVRADFTGARLDDVQFPDCDLSGADVTGATCAAVDLRGARLDGLRGIGALRGATIGVDQLFGLAPGLAAAAGLTIAGDDD